MPEPTLYHDVGDLQTEYRAAREHVALFDLSDRGKVEMIGSDARTFLQNLCTNDIKNLSAGQSCEAFLTNLKAKVVAFVMIHHPGSEEKRDRFLLDVGPGMGEKVVQHLERYHISEDVDITNRTTDFAQLHLAGPKAEALLAQVSVPLVFRSNDPLGVPGYDVFIEKAKAVELGKKLMEGSARPASVETYELLRVEAGTPAYDHEIDDERFVVELGRGAKAISYSKGCFLGQEPIVMARDRGHVNRMLMGLKFSGSAPLAKGVKLFHNGEEVGQVTSSVISPRLGAIALAFLRRGHQEPGTLLDIETADSGRKAEVSALPF